ncbi:hypothetical protein B6V73_00100 [Thioclava sp. JM3]|uniref:S49 family peptidase n=1 Tax=Thioclava sp. JM3 TaxID=1973004 RepID=UPI000B544907|nr:S49 family peptidase [Thioclava sp. JM3]OWY18257.1 hypothetical protein B6V73_00100 [Thioclava sp. JM3]
MTQLHHIAERVIGRPLFLHPTKAAILLDVLEGRLSEKTRASAGLPADASRFIGSRSRADRSSRLNRAVNGAAIITIEGSLVNRGAWIGSNSGLVSYEGISAQVREARADQEIRTVILDLDTPGGEATGMFAAAQLIRELAAEKRVIAVVNDLAASAGYGLASAADEIVASPTSIVGSIGVVMTHVDASKKLAQDGYSVTQIFSGDHKVDGNPFGPLPDAVKADLQTECQYFYSLFVGMVATGRGERLTEEMARATQARTFIGEEAVKRGLADRVASLDEVLAELSPTRAGAARNAGGPSMTTKYGSASKSAEYQDGRAAGYALGVSGERSRISKIMKSDAARGRVSQALNLALETDLAADKVISLLGSPTDKFEGARSATDERAPSNVDEMWEQVMKEVVVSASPSRAPKEEREGGATTEKPISAEAVDEFWAAARKEAGV